MKNNTSYERKEKTTEMTKQRASNICHGVHRDGIAYRPQIYISETTTYPRPLYGTRSRSLKP
jgi:hypothetical protein